MFSVEAQKTYTKKLYKNDNVDSPLMIEPPQLEFDRIGGSGKYCTCDLISNL